MGHEALALVRRKRRTDGIDQKVVEILRLYEAEHYLIDVGEMPGAGVHLLSAAWRLSNPTVFPSLSRMKAIHSAWPRSPKRPSESTKISWGSVRISTQEGDIRAGRNDTFLPSSRPFLNQAATVRSPGGSGPGS